MKQRIEKYGFLENTDFVEEWNNPRNEVVIKYTGNVNSMNQKGYTKDYIITLDRAKELSMVKTMSKVDKQENTS